MDEESSPPSSRKSSVIGKLDRADTPRASPYLTRSRRSSTLTEENLAKHNDSPVTRSATKRLTRRNSQSSESAPVSTPMPQPTRRTRRSPSVTSADELPGTPKKKFSVPKENVVLEEDEPIDENSGDVQTPSQKINGSTVGHQSDEQHLSTLVDECSPEVRVVLKTGEIDTLTGKGSAEAIVTKESVVTTEPIVGIGTIADTDPTVDTVAIVVTGPESIVATEPNVVTESIVAAEPTVVTESIVAAEPTVDSNKPTETESNTSIPQLVNISTITAGPPQSPKTPIAQTSRRNQDLVNKLQTNVDSPLESSDKTPHSSLGSDASTQSVDTLETTKEGDITVIANAEFDDAVFENTTPVKANSIQMSNIISLLETPVGQKTDDAAKVQVVPGTPIEIFDTPVAQKQHLSVVITLPETPMQTENVTVVDSAVSTISQATPKKSPQSATKTLTTDTIEATTPHHTSTAVVTNPETPNAKTTAPVHQNISTATESEEETLLRTPPPSTPSSKSNAAPLNPNPSGDDNKPKPETSTVPLQNGTADAASDKQPRWGASVHRQSDGQPIDKFGVDKTNEKAATLTVQSKKKNISIVSVHDSSDSDDEEEETKSQNMFLDDEAMESNGEASMDEEERQYLEENEIPEDGISLGSDSADDEQSDENESNDSFIVSDSSVQLLDGSGDDLEMDGAPVQLNVSKTKRGNKIFDTSDEEMEKPRKSSTSKRRSDDDAVNNTAKHPKLDVVAELATAKHNNIDDSDDDLANLDVISKPKRLKRLSESKTSSKKEMNRLSLHPNTKLNTLKSNDEQQSIVSKEDPIADADSSEEELTQVLANVDDGPKKTIRSKRLSDALSTLKADPKRMSLHPNTKFASQQSIPKENVENEVDQKESDNVTDELANLDDEPKAPKGSKRLSELGSSTSKKETNRRSLHPNTKLTSIETMEMEEGPQSTENDPNVGIVNHNKDVREEVPNLDGEAKLPVSAKRLSESMTITKKDAKRFSLNAKMIGSSVNIESVADVNEPEAMEVDHHSNDQQAGPSVKRPKMEIETSFEDIRAKCSQFLQQSNEVKQQEKLKNKPQLPDDKYQRKKEKRAAKLLERKEKEARELEAEELAAKKRQLKREKKSRMAEITEQERSDAIEKALLFSEHIKAEKVKKSVNGGIQPPFDTSSEEEASTSKKRKRQPKQPKMLQILNDEPVQTQKKRRVDNGVAEPQLPAKPEGFKINSQATTKPMKRNKQIKKIEATQKVQKTSAGSFQVEVVPKKQIGSFEVTTLQYNPSQAFSSSKKEQIIFNSNVKRESADALLRRKKQQKRN